MKKLVSLTLCATMVLSSLALTVDLSPFKISSIDVVSAASETESAKESTPAKPTTTKQETKSTTTTKPTTKSTTNSTTTKPASTKSTNSAGKDADKPAAVAPKVEEVPQNPYQDGVYVAYGNAYSKGTEGAKVTIKDGKIADVELMRTSPKLIDRDVRNNFNGLWQAYEPMKNSLLGRTREEAAEADVVSGATRSGEGWKLAVDRAFERALTEKPAGEVYFAGEHMGVDPEGKYMVFANYDKTKLLGVKVYPLNEKGEAVEASAMTPEQAKTVYTIASELLYRGTNAVAANGMEADFKAAVNAFWDAEQNAKIKNNSKYVDGFYSAYGAARDKGVERADVYIRNGKLVDVKLYRLGSNLLDRGETAYAEVVKANAPMTAKLLANGSYIENYSDTDAISGATESSHSWNEAVERAFEKALKTPEGGKYFEGTFAGVDNRSQVLVLADIQGDKVTKTAIHLFDQNGKLIAEDNLTEAQKALIAGLSDGLVKHGANLALVPGEELVSAAAKAAYADALQNASKVQGEYKDGTFTAYAGAYDKGANRADVTLRNGNIVGINLYRVGVNMEDRGETAYAEVVKAIPIMENSFMMAASREKAAEVDAVSGATSSTSAFKSAVDGAYKKAEISEAYKTAYLNGVFAGTNAGKSVYVMVTIEKNVPVKMEVFYLDEAGKVKANDTLSTDELAVKQEIETPAAEGGMHKYAYRPAAFGDTDAIKALSGKVIEAVKAALEAAGR
ncbi:FMN-binding protein [Paenibacillus sp. M1]|uniref:FMN-binding protein n=1 Tax=Paenibacillus haidiansis TaxID=1574488 RepID=A0ABU7VMQ7_9BACL